MNKYIRKPWVILGVIFAVLILAALVFGNMKLAGLILGGDDFLAHWQGARTFVQKGISPYSQESTKIINELIRGLGNSEQSGDYRFINPLFSLLFYLPFCLLKNHEIAHALWMTISEIALVISTLSLIMVVVKKRTMIPLLVLTFLSILSYPVFNQITGGDIVVIGLALFNLAVVGITKRKDETAGFLLALTLVKPEVFIFPVLLIVFWSLFKKRTQLFFYFWGTVILLIGFSMVLIPDWPLQYLKLLISSMLSNPVLQEGTTFFNQSSLSGRFYLIINGVIFVWSIYEWYITRENGRYRFLWLAVVTLILGGWIGRREEFSNGVEAMPGMLVGLALIWERWKGRSVIFVMTTLCTLFVVGWIFSPVLIPSINIALSEIVLNLILPMLILLLLIWSRWWVFQFDQEYDIYVEK